MSKLLSAAEKVPIEKLRLSDHAFEILERSGIRNLAQLMVLSVDELKQFHGLGQTTLDEIISVREESTREIALGHIFSEEDPAQDPAVPVHENTLGFDLPLEDLGLSVRSLGALRREGYRTLAEIMNLTEEDLMRIRNLGRGSVEEILRVRREKAAAPQQTDTVVSKPMDEHAPDSAAPAFDLPLEELGLSVRSLGALQREGYRTLLEIMNLTEEDLMCIRNLGRGSVEEILRVRREKAAALQQTDMDGSKPMDEHAQNSALSAFDLPLEELGLSVRSFGALKRAGYHTLSEIMELTKADLMGIWYLGRNSVEEVLRVRREKAEELRQSGSDRAGVPTIEAEAMGAAAEISERLQVDSFTVAKRLLAKLNVRAAVCSVLAEAPLQTAFERAILTLLEQTNDGAAFSEITAHFGETIPTEAVQACLDTLSENGRIRFDDGIYKRYYPSVSDFVASLADERTRSFLEQRLAGKTLDEVGTANGMTRERVRQICVKALSLRPHLYEDKYRAIYENYEWSREDFRLAFGEPDAAFLYLQLVYRHGSKPIAQILTDEEIPAKLRRRAERAVYKNDVVVDGVRLHRDRQTLVRYAVRRFCTEQTKFETFLEQYQEMLDTLELGDDPKLVISARTYENHILSCGYALWIYPRTLRAYPVEDVDKDAFWEAMNLSQYMNMTVSAELLFREHQELMQELDVRDGYELHNLMRKLCPEDQTLIQFGRQPMLTIGQGDLQSQLLDLLLQYAPITVDALAKKCREHFGILEQTAIGTYFRYLDEYCYDGVFRIDAANLPPERFRAMQDALPGDIYTIQKVRSIYRSLFPQANDSDINPYTLKTMGFRVYSGYVVRNIWQNAAAYFTHLLTERDVVDLRSMDSEMLSYSSFTQVLYSLKAAREIVEFAPQQYVNIRRLEENGVTRADLEDYCEKAAAFAEPGQFFTVTSLRNAGFRHPLDEIGFDEWFYASVLIEDREHFSYRRCGGSKLLFRGVRDIQLTDYLAQLVEQEPLELYDLQDLLQNGYGLTLAQDKLMQAIRDSDLYYDSIMEKLYPDYDTYYEEI